MLVRPEMVYGLKTKEQEVELKTLRFHCESPEWIKLDNYFVCQNNEATAKCHSCHQRQTVV